MGRAITLVESRKPDHRPLAQEMLEALQVKSGNSRRIGITGVPGVGKSTFIEKFGGLLTDKGHRVAVLAVDPTSSRTGGSILGDKTRMQTLSQDPFAFIRPSPSAGTLGGVARATRETILVVEAAGYDVVLVETVGVGQSETTVADMVDLFMVLMLPGAGDDLQGIKKGVLEIADMLVVNKADGDNAKRARRAAADYKAALNILMPVDPNWMPPVMTASGLTGEGLDAVWESVGEHRGISEESGRFAARRTEQQVDWMRSMVRDRLSGLLDDVPGLRDRADALEAEVAAGTMPPAVAAERVVDTLKDYLSR